MKKLGVALLLTGVLISSARAETVTYLHTDLLGSVVLETDQNRNVVKRYEYEPYGLPRQAIADAPGYTGHVHDAGSGLVYMQQRYYDPEVGRFLSVDPMPADTATGWNFNRYNYAANNPYTFVDPDGRMVGKPWEEPSGSLPDPLSGPDDLRRHAGLVSFSEDGGQSRSEPTDHKLHMISSDHLPAGHVAIAGESPDGRIEAIGFYPNESTGYYERVRGDVAGMIKDDRPLFDAALAGKLGVSMHTFHVTRTQHDTALRTIREFAEGNPWNLYTRNCVHAAAASLRAAGVVDLNTGGVLAPSPAAIGLIIHAGVLQE